MDSGNHHGLQISWGYWSSPLCLSSQDCEAPWLLPWPFETLPPMLDRWCSAQHSSLCFSPSGFLAVALRPCYLACISGEWDLCPPSSLFLECSDPPGILCSIIAGLRIIWFFPRCKSLWFPHSGISRLGLRAETIVTSNPLIPLWQSDICFHGGNHLQLWTLSCLLAETQQ